MAFQDSFLYAMMPNLLLGAFTDLEISYTLSWIYASTQFYLGCLLRVPWISGLQGFLALTLYVL